MGSLRLSKVVVASVVVCVSILLLSPPTGTYSKTPKILIKYKSMGGWQGDFPIDRCWLWPLDKILEKGTCRERCLEKKRLYPDRYSCIYDGYCSMPISPTGLSGLHSLCMCRCHEK
ncbi:hypothetical protein N665_0030s0185 [Sinapis alba]|nr:hypothetical protein N665_0030s0185 [Sinapis alba]